MTTIPKVLIIGPVCNISGYSEHARTIADAFISLGNQIDLYIQDTQWASATRSHKYAAKYEEYIHKTTTLFQQRANPNGEINIAGLFDTTYQVRPPNEFQQMSENDIGVTAALETTFAPSEWVSPCNLMNHILVVSQHAQNNLKNTKSDSGERIKTPISIIPFGYKAEEKLDIYTPMGLTTKFNFLTVLQMAPRKNFDNMLKWFIEEFKDDEDVGLVIKTYAHNNSTVDFHHTRDRLNGLLDTICKERKCRVYLVHGSLSSQEMESLYNPDVIKCYISTTHGEGFGIPLFQAACNNIPVIATNWSGHLDFLRIPVLSKSKKKKIKSHFMKVGYDIEKVKPHHLMPGLITEKCEWAYPREESFKKHLKSIRKGSRFLDFDVSRLTEYLRETQDISVVRDKYSKFLQKDLSLTNYDDIPITRIPKISIITSVYDGDDYIDGFMEDITRQSIFKEKCELILINANSPGNEEDVINKYIKKYPDNIVYRRLEEDPGIYAVWNMGVEISTGEYLTNANLDDRKSPDSLEYHAKTLCVNDDVDLVYADCYVTDTPNQKFEDNDPSWRQLRPFAYTGKETLLKSNSPHNNPMWRKTLHDKYGIFNNEYFSAGDWEMWLRAAFAGSKFLCLNKILGLYYVNPTGISTNKETEKKKQKEEFSIFKTYQKLFLQGS
jgi:glycosyltransferase involved in cell wall biosynthesis